MGGTTYDVSAVRAQFPALRHGVAHFDGPGGSQVPSAVAQAVADTMTGGLCQRGTFSETERRTDAVTLGARAAVGDLLGVDPRGVVFGRSMTQLTMDMARTLASSQEWGPGDEVVVSRLDHDSNIRPWVIAAESVGATVRWLDFDPVTAEVDDIESVLTTQTRLVAITAASNLFGTRPDVAAVAAAVHEVGALVYVDAVHLTPHAPVDAAALGADLIACSPYKFFGPHLGVLAAAPSLLESLHPAKLMPSTDAVPERFELGTLPYELLAGVTAAVDFIAGLAPGDGGDDRRAGVLASMATVEAYEDELLERLLAGLGALDGVTLHGSPARRTPTALFSVAGHAAREVHEKLAADGINAPGGSFYALEASRHAGLGDEGAVRAGIAPYTSAEEVDRLVEAVAALVGAAR
ncbi:cysteine desulfurase-like protein [Nocardioides sp. KIGAM211]|uniref:Cysteine desulfurase-like protein n=1 Tax=Nocardioides luti TaxID=2761101 RepID=A0A7X0V9R2_9ACTN|nr:cysteine desulfurase-like protein [Nocardioides luti]MBB6626954.1 cysteine desulfurase-like protein [Nocardioides luti]